MIAVGRRTCIILAGCAGQQGESKLTLGKGRAVLRALIVSDVHSNLEAFTSVIEDAGSHGGFGEVWSLGDLVGYGPDPGAVIEILNGFPHHAVAGNHDLASVGLLGLEAFNPYAEAANRWTSGVLSAEEREYLISLTLKTVVGEFTLVHGSPRDPVWEYVVSIRSAMDNFDHFDTLRCLVGHSHVPFICRWDEAKGTVFIAPRYEVPYYLREERLIVNPGSVGQPRDGDPRAAYAIYDSEQETVTHYRISYDIAATQMKMRAHGIPEYLVERLDYGR